EKRVKQRFEGVPVLASIKKLKELLQAQPVNLVILANPALCHKELRRIVMLCQSCGIKSKILPNVDEILNGNVAVRHIRDVKLEDLLGRPPVRLDVKNIRNYLENKRVLVTGAAGSIGQEICHQVAGFGVSSLVLFDNAETPLFQIERNLREKFPELEIIPCLSDIRSAIKVDSVFACYSPEVVFHAAAYKHVPMSEHNPISAIENNTLGTRTLVNAARQFGVDHFVMVSTDKAVNPTNIMGASKRAAEIYAQALYNQIETTVVTVRFGNVLGSNGSVVPIFREQIKKGGPVTVTDSEATRFFMTIPEAVQLVLQAGSMGRGGEIFLLNMGEQIKIVHLAEELIRLSGMAPYQDIDIEFTGLRPGEKLHEELLLASEGVKPTTHEKICVANSITHNPYEIDKWFDQLAEACQSMNEKRVMSIIKTLVPEYHHEQNGHISRPETTSTSYIKQKVVRIPLNAVRTA
ncbi:MAG: polysaccharide biosynthesis protein, partial [Desulfuromonadales bacterium]|nr:polysaccharide biosynthesis protein [Desulfuromonadales bacterium]